MADDNTTAAAVTAERTQRNTGSFATRLLQKALDDRKKTDPNMKIPDFGQTDVKSSDVQEKELVGAGSK